MSQYWMHKMLEPEGVICFRWLEDYATNGSMTLEEMNDLFTERHIGGIILTLILMVSSLFGNVIVLWIFGRKFKRSNYRTYTLWLAAIDLTNCCIGMPFVLVYLTNYITFPFISYCKLGRFNLVYTANASSFVLVVIGVDRYRRICLTKQIPQLRETIACCSVVALALLISWPNFAFFGIHKIDSLPLNITGSRCWEDDDFEVVNVLRDFYIGMCCLSFVVTIILFISYSLIVKFIYQNERINNHAQKITLTLLIVTAAYILSSMPHSMLVALYLQMPTLHCYMSFKEGFVLYIFAWSNLISNSINPFIYGFSDMRFKTELKAIVTSLREKLCKLNTCKNINN